LGNNSKLVSFGGLFLALWKVDSDWGKAVCFAFSIVVTGLGVFRFC
jgi:hypothetical protein